MRLEANYVVRRAKPDGTIEDGDLTSRDWVHNAFIERDDAEARAMQLATFNPTACYVVVPLGGK